MQLTLRTLDYLAALRQNLDPTTHRSLPADSPFTRPTVRRAVSELWEKLRECTPPNDQTASFLPLKITDRDHKAEPANFNESTNPERTQDSDNSGRPSITPDLLSEARTRILEAGLRFEPKQLMHFLRGSRRMIHPNLVGLPSFGCLGKHYTRSEIEASIHVWLGTERDTTEEGNEKPATSLANQKPASNKKNQQPWRKEPFFAESFFDRLSVDKAAELAAEVSALPLVKPVDKLPEFQRRARKNHPRAYEPWSRPERALLLEAMCYTNDLDRLAPLFGRGRGSVRQAGQRLIWESRQNRPATGTVSATESC